MTIEMGYIPIFICHLMFFGGGRDHMVVGFTTPCAIKAYQH